MSGLQFFMGLSGFYGSEPQHCHLRCLMREGCKTGRLKRTMWVMKSMYNYSVKKKKRNSFLNYITPEYRWENHKFECPLPHVKKKPTGIYRNYSWNSVLFISVIYYSIFF